MHYTSYKGNAGTWFSPGLADSPGQSNWTALLGQANGVFNFYSTTSIASITDGTSNTLLFSETAYGKLVTAGDVAYWCFWVSGDYGDTMFTTLYPINPQRKLASDPATQGVGTDVFVASASSFHPGGVNSVFCDGSVRFIKDSINTLPFSPTTGIPLAYNQGSPVCSTNGAPTYTITPGTSNGIWQAISTRAGGEVVSSDAY